MIQHPEAHIFEVNPLNKVEPTDNQLSFYQPFEQFSNKSQKLFPPFSFPLLFMSVLPGCQHHQNHNSKFNQFDIPMTCSTWAELIHLNQPFFLNLQS